MRTLHGAEKLKADDIIRFENGTMTKVRHDSSVEVADLMDMMTGIKCVYRLGEVELSKGDVLLVGDEHKSVVGYCHGVIDENSLLYKMNIYETTNDVVPGSFFTRPVDEFALKDGPYTDDELFSIGWDHGFFEKTVNSPIGENEDYLQGKGCTIPFFHKNVTVQYVAGYLDGRFGLKSEFPSYNEYCDGYDSGREFRLNILKGE